jgi:hypothetical protein
MLAEAIVRRFPALKSLGEATTGMRATGWLSLAIAQVEAERQERARSGRMFSGMGKAAGTAPVQAMPTTTAMDFLWNQDANRSLIIESIDYMLLSGTMGVGATVVAIVTPITGTFPTLASGSLITNTSAGGLTSKALFAAAYTIPTPAGNSFWGIVSQVSSPGGAGSVGSMISCPVDGNLIVPPGRGLGLAVISATATSPLFVANVSWHEAELDAE